MLSPGSSSTSNLTSKTMLLPHPSCYSRRQGLFPGGSISGRISAFLVTQEGLSLLSFRSNCPTSGSVPRCPRRCRGGSRWLGRRTGWHQRWYHACPTALRYVLQGTQGGTRCRSQTHWAQGEDRSWGAVCSCAEQQHFCLPQCVTLCALLTYSFVKCGQITLFRVLSSVMPLRSLA